MTLEELQSLVESNAKTIQGILDAFASDRDARKENDKLRRLTAELQNRTVLAELDAIKSKVDSLRDAFGRLLERRQNIDN
jgi:hypothetical protein